jgi:hypothetical protein
MKFVKLFIITTLFINFFNCFSQDIITKKSGEDIKAKILEVGISEIKYRNFDNQEGPIYSLLIQDILIVRYQNGTKDIFNNNITSESSLINSNDNSSLFFQGEKDAKKYYKGYKGSGTATLVTSIVLSSFIGLVPAITTSTTDPIDSNLNYPNSDLMKKPEYYNGYVSQAKKIKQKKVWSSWLVGLGVNILAFFVFTQ